MAQTAESSAQLPVELIDIIALDIHPTERESLPWTETASADFSTGDLLACSLVCRQWRAAMLPHLFHSITYSFRPERDEDGDGDSPHPGPSKGSARYKTISMLCEFLDSNPAVGPWIRRLKLVYRPSRWSVGMDPGDYPPIYPEDVLDPQPFARVLELCTRVDELHLAGVLLHDIDLPTHSARKTLQYLKLSPYHNFKPTEEDALPGLGKAVVAPLVLFSTLKRLCFSELVFPGELTEAAAFPFPNVDSLEFEGRGEGMMGVYYTLKRSPAATSIRSLTVDSLRTNDHGSYRLSCLLYAVGPSLDTMVCRNIGLNPLGGDTTCKLERCTRLRSLFIGAHITAHSCRIARRIGFFTWDIASSAPLERIELVLEFHEDATEGMFWMFESDLAKVRSRLVKHMMNHAALRITVTAIIDQRSQLHNMPPDNLRSGLGFSTKSERLQVLVMYK